MGLLVTTQLDLIYNQQMIVVKLVLYPILLSETYVRKTRQIVVVVP